jgi:hypothetical protein
MKFNLEAVFSNPTCLRSNHLFTCTRLIIVKYTCRLETKRSSRTLQKNQETLNMYKGLHPRSDIHRWYLPQQKGGRGLKMGKQPYRKKNKVWANTCGVKKDPQTPSESCMGYKRNSHATRHKESLERPINNHGIRHMEKQATT